VDGARSTCLPPRFDNPGYEPESDAARSDATKVYDGRTTLTCDV